MKSASKFVVSNYIKSFASAILKHESIDSQVANKYWNKEIQRKHKEKIKKLKHEKGE